MPYNNFEGELDSPNVNILSAFENSPALRAMDIAINKKLGGHPETISARVGREKDTSPIAKVMAETLDRIDPGHTERALQNSPVTKGLVPFQGELDQPPQQRTATQQLLRQLGLTGRAGLTGVTGMASILADAGATGVNALGGNMQMPSQALQGLMTKAGLPEPEGTQENVVQVLSSMLAGGGDPISRGLQAATTAKVPAGFGAAQTQARQQVAKELHDAGYKIPPTMAEGGLASRSIEGIGGTKRTEEMARYLAEDVTNDLARKALKLPVGTQLTKDVLKQQAVDLVKTGYEPIKQAGKMTNGSVYRKEMTDIIKEFSTESYPKADKTAIRELVSKYMEPVYNAKDQVKTISILRREADDAFKPGGDSSVGLAKRAIAKAMEHSIELNLEKRATQYANMLQRTGARNVKLKGPDPTETLENFRSARVALAKNDAVKDMLADPNTGIVSTVKAAAMLKKGAPLTDELLTIAKAGSPAFAKATGLANAGQPSPINFGDMGYMAMGGLSSPFTGGLGGALAAYPAIKAGARHAVLSDPMQKLLFASRPNAAGAGSIFGGAPVHGPASFGVPAQLLPLFNEEE